MTVLSKRSKSNLKIILLSLCLGTLITMGTLVVKRDHSYDVGVCEFNSNNISDFKVVDSVTIHFSSAGFPWTFKDYEPENPVNSNCPEPLVAYYQSSFSSNTAHFIYDAILWSVVVSALLYYIKPKRKKK
jgi:hypothetical protein